MINRELKTVQLLTYTQETDEFGQLRQSTPTSMNIEALIKKHVVNNPEDMRFVDVEVIALTKEKNITDKNEIKDGDLVYEILYTVNTSRYNELFMRVKHG